MILKAKILLVTPSSAAVERKAHRKVRAGIINTVLPIEKLRYLKENDLPSDTK